MLAQGTIAAVLCVVAFSGSYATASMTNSWAVQITSGGEEAADELAKKCGFDNLGQVARLKDVHHFMMPVDGSRGRRSVNNYPDSDHLTECLRANDNVGYVQQQERKKLYKKEGYDIPTDPNFDDQWSLLNTGQLNESDIGMDLNVEGAWLQGSTGCGIVVAIVDDGVEYTHSDLSGNYVAGLQFDILRREPDAFPVTIDGMRENHGTSVAGEIVMEKGNGVCGIGVAYNSFITGVRLISEEEGSTDMDQAEALNWQNSVIDIYSNSWGPSDDGMTVSGPGPLAEMAERYNGRGGLGSIFTFAAGNGGVYDSCAADGYTNSIYTISVGSAASNGQRSSFDEMCSAKMVVTFDSDPYEDERHVTTTNVNNMCYDGFVGTSASTPLVSGVLALLLEENPALSWRDVQYLIAYTANTNNLVDGEFTTNGAGLNVSHKFGFGAIDAEAIVSRGRHWINIPEQLSQDIVPIDSSRFVDNAEVEDSTNILTINFTVESDIVSLEHVVLFFYVSFVGVSDNDLEGFMDAFENGFDIFWPERGRVLVDLTSPSGTTSRLLPRRLFDIFPDAYIDWPLMSVHFWGEDPAGTWTINVTFFDSTGTIEVDIPRVTLYGTSEVPEAVSRIPAQCSSECDPTRGCAASGAEFCDACAQLRLAPTLQCVSSCPEGLTERNGYCYNATVPESTCNAETPTPEPTSSAIVIGKSANIYIVPVIAVFALLQRHFH